MDKIESREEESIDGSYLGFLSCGGRRYGMPDQTRLDERVWLLHEGEEELVRECVVTCLMGKRYY